MYTCVFELCDCTFDRKHAYNLRCLCTDLAVAITLPYQRTIMTLCTWILLCIYCSFMYIESNAEFLWELVGQWHKLAYYYLLWHSSGADWDSKTNRVGHIPRLYPLVRVHLHPTPSAGQSSNVSRLGRFGQKQFPYHLTIGTSHRVTKQVQPSLDELCRYSCKTKAAH